MAFLIIGGNPEAMGVYREQTERVGLDNVKLVGFVSNSELPLYLDACYVLPLPYQQKVAASGEGDTSEYMSPMKMFEYMASGRVIISSDLPVLREVLTEHNAMLCDPANVDEWH